MKSKLLDYLCDPIDKSELELENPVYDKTRNIIEGMLTSKSGRNYFIRDGIPRFVGNDVNQKSVESFGNEWNYFNFDQFKTNWLNHTVKNTFGSPDIFRGKVIVDAGAGSGMQSLWMSQSGADYIISLELSHSVDGIMKENLQQVDNVDVVQCSIDQPPIKDSVIDGIVVCHNVIQHTRSVEDTARALWCIVSQGGEFVFNCYAKNDLGLIRKLRLKLYSVLRNFFSQRSFRFLLNYSRLMSILRFIPILGLLLEKSSVMVRGDIPKGPHYIKRCYIAGVLNTFDCYGSHSYQHLKSDDEIKRLITALQPDSSKVLNVKQYFSMPQPIGCALRLFK